MVVGEKRTLKNFFIRNTGNGTFKGMKITRIGTGAGNFIVTQPTEVSVAGGVTATFKVTFKPMKKGTRSAEIHIGSNDADESPFDIKLTGMGAAR